MQQVISTQRISVLEKENNVSGTHIVRRFINWCEQQEQKRFLWMAVAFLGHIGTVLPLTIFTIVNTGNNFSLLVIACTVNIAVLALNLAAQSTKVTLPALFFAWLTNAVIIAYCLVGFTV